MAFLYINLFSPSVLFIFPPPQPVSSNCHSLQLSYLLLPTFLLLDFLHFPIHKCLSVSLTAFALTPATFPSCLFICGIFIREQGNIMPPNNHPSFTCFSDPVSHPIFCLHPLPGTQFFRKRTMSSFEFTQHLKQYDSGPD